MKLFMAAMFALLIGCSDHSSDLSSLQPKDLQVSEQNFVDYVDAYTYPHFIQDNNDALDARIKLLDQAPRGSVAKILTFVWENGSSTNLLAAHMCKAAKRGVDVQFMADSKYGSLVENDSHWFNEPANEEIYQWLANCGVKIRIYNKIPELYNNEVFHRRFFTTRSTAKARIVARSRKEYGSIAMSPLNRLNHRKLFVVEKVVKGKKVGCMILGGRNLGDHYLSWKNEGNQFLDSDVILCRQHLSDQQERNYQVFKSAHDSFEDVWAIQKETIYLNGDKSNKTSRDVVHQIPPRKDFYYDHLWFARKESNDRLSEKNPHRKNKVFKGDEEKPQKVRMIPLAKTLPKPHIPVFGIPMKNTTRWKLKTSGWDADYSNDFVREELYKGIDAELSEIYIESAYLTLDSEMRSKIEQALERGVQVTLVSNSAFTMDGEGAKLISIGNIDFIHAMKSRYPDHIKAYYLTAMAGHMLHFKGAAFRCQKMIKDYDTKNSDNKRQIYQKKFILGSHNFHPRSGMSDKEHALVWNEKIGQTCIDRLEVLGLEADDIDISPNPIEADNKDGVGLRLSGWYQPVVEDFYGNKISIIVEFDEYIKNWEQYNARPDDGIIKRIQMKFHKYLFRDDGRMVGGAAGILGLLKPHYEKYL